MSPTDVEFKQYLESNYNPPGVFAPNVDTVKSDVHIPVLDKPISPHEVLDQPG